MLYDGAIVALERAVIAIEAHDIPKKCDHLKRAMAIIVQLEGTLNMELGGEVAQTLKSFYMYARAQATKANIENSPGILRSLIEKFSTVRDAWDQIAHPSPPPAAAPPSGGARPDPFQESELPSLRLIV